MSDQLDPELKSTRNIRLDVAESMNSLIIMEQGVFVPSAHFGTGILINMSWGLMLFIYIASISSDALSKATECISRQISLSSDNSFLVLSQLSHLRSSDPNTPMFVMMASSLLCTAS